MSQHSWQLHDLQARLQCGAFTAAVDLRRPDRGLTEICWAGRSLSSDGLLGIELPAIDQLHADGVEGYQRGVDLIATYHAVDDRPFRIQLYWRAWLNGAAPRLAAVELVASVQTHLLDSNPRLFTRSRLTGRGVRRLMDSTSARFEPCLPPSEAGCLLTSESGCGCTLIDLEGTGLSYAEMVHPVDFDSSELVSVHGIGDVSIWTLRHQLFTENLEKGVILRARVLAAWFERDSDDRDVAAVYREFAASEPPLNT